MRFLGLDCSTQSLTALVIDIAAGEVVARVAVNYDEALPHYGTEHGALPSAGREGLVHSPPEMWAEALDVALGALGEQTDVALIRAVAGSGQQHGSVYLAAEANERLEHLDAERPLAPQLQGIFSRPTSPIWQDSSTTRECEEIREALGGVAASARLTGSDVFERFTGPQIRRFSKEEPEAWERTAHVALVSSFLASLLGGRLAPVDPGDGAGTNLMNLPAGRWSSRALQATAPGLPDRLPRLTESDRVIGCLSPYWAERHGLRGDTLLLPFSGDNPCSLIGLGIVEPGRVGVSLGTSDTYFALVAEPVADDRGEGHVFGSPTGDWMALNCFRNGSLAREAIRAGFGLSWTHFSEALAQAPPGNGGRLMLPWFEPEIVPRILRPGVRRSLDLAPDDAPANCRAVVEAQMMAMRNHSKWMGSGPRLLTVTGGGSRNPAILQVMADVFDCVVQTTEIESGAALGAALRAAHGFGKARGPETGWLDLVQPFTAPSTDRVFEPHEKAVAIYAELCRTYAAWEAEERC